MSHAIFRETCLRIGRDGVVGRRDFLRGISAAGLASGSLAWSDLVGLHAAELRRRGMACILLWMQGGPSQFETFDPKPGHANGGQTEAIDTAAPGIQIADNLPLVAGVADRLAIVRSLTTREGNHQRASFLLHTSYVPNASVHYPTLGSVVASEVQRDDGQLPAFVRIGQRFANASAGGFLGTQYDPFVVASAQRPPENATPTTDVARYQRRLGLLDRLETASASDALQRHIEDHRQLYSKAATMILSPQMKAFDLAGEPDKLRDAYGRSEFGAGCLLARRLVEAGVTFVEVGLGNWDTHDDNFNRSQTLCQQLDQPFAQLIRDLDSRGLLDSTLVVWMGEFGRTPRINPRGGRDHYPRAFSAVLAGAGVRGGQVIGRTSPGGEEVVDRPVTEKDLFQSIYHSLKINAAKENMSPIGRPIKIVDGGAPVSELFA